MITLTPDQRELARHALGLGRKRKSYRNNFAAEPGTPYFDVWQSMCAAGLAQRGGTRPGGLVPFRLTRAAAEAALGPGESLDPEDFPPS